MLLTLLTLLETTYPTYKCPPSVLPALKISAGREDVGFSLPFLSPFSRPPWDTNIYIYKAPAHVLSSAWLHSETRALLLLLFSFFVLPPWQVPLHCFIVLCALRAPNLALLWSPPRPSPLWPVSDMWAVIAFLCALRKLYSSSEALFWDNLGQTCFGLCSDSIFFSSLLPF